MQAVVLGSDERSEEGRDDDRNGLIGVVSDQWVSGVDVEVVTWAW
jgi:hypothetical protein